MHGKMYAYTTPAPNARATTQSVGTDGANNLGLLTHTATERRFVERANEKPTAFLELELTIRNCTELACQADDIFCKIVKPRSESGRGRFSRQLLSFLQTS